MDVLKDNFEDFYDVFEEIGKGHFAVVKRCVNKETGEEYAGKLIRKKRVCRGVPMEDIQREIRTLNQLEHPGIIKLHDIYDTGQSVVLLLELVTGGELFHYVSQQGRLTEAQSVHIVRQICEAVSHMHSQNIAHLDLKPENVLLVKKSDMPVVKVIDFGLSHRLDTVAEIKAMFGTPEFVAPEVVNFEKLTLATDMWAVGVITYILLSGASPFLGDTVQETYSNVSSATYEFDKMYFENVSDFAKDFITRLLVKDPKKRDSVFDSLGHPWLQSKITEILTPPVTLLSAIKEGDINSFEDILNSGHANIDQTNKNGETALHLAAAYGRDEMARHLVMCGANVALVDSQGDTSLIHAARHASTNILLLLIKVGACVCTQNHEGETALHVAAAWGELEVVKILVENGGLLHIPNHVGQLPLHVAIQRRHSLVAHYLLNAGTDFDLHDSDGNAPIHLAVREGMLSVVQALCSLGCNLDVANNHGLCPIHLAARFGLTDIVRCLCLAGCDTEIRNSDGIKAEITALKYGFNEISDLLNKIKSNYARDNYIRQLLPNDQPLPRFNIQFFGHSGVGKSTLVETLKTGYFSGLFKRTKSTQFNMHYAPLLSSRSQPNSPSHMQIEMDSTSRQNSLNFDLYNHYSTRGIDVQQVTMSGAGDVTLWDFSGQDTYFGVYHHVITTSAKHAIFVLVFSLSDSSTMQFKQCSFWLTFLQARIPPVEPIGNGGRTSNTPRVILVGTHADATRAPRQSNGDYISPQAISLVKKLRSTFSAFFDIHPTPIVVDAHVPNSYGIKLLKTTFGDLKNSVWQGGRQMSGFCEAVLSWLPSLRKFADSVPVMTWETFIEEVRNQVNPLAGEDHFRDLLSQLEHMGEIICIQDLIVLSPSWLCSQVFGQLLSIDFITHARITGCYTVEDFQVAFPEADAMAMLQVLEALQLCIQCENDGELEYEFPCYNLVERLDGLWEASDPRYADGTYGGVRLKSPPGTTHLLHCVFPRLQIELRRTVMGFYDWQSDLYQWLCGSKLCFGAIESLITLERGADKEDEAIEVKVRGPPGSGKNCFVFMDELLGIIDHVLFEVIPGLPVEKHFLSSHDLRVHAVPVHCYQPHVLMEAVLQENGLNSEVKNPLSNVSETVLQLISFGEVDEMVCGVNGISVGMLSTLCVQRLCSLLDPADPHGRDWCLLAVRLGLTQTIATIETTDCSTTAALLNHLSSHPDNSVGTLIKKLQELGREDAAEVLKRLAPLYRVVSDVGQTQQSPSDCSRNLSR
ncbi:hypothetical protein AAG570_006792 [Ranatra chinensis]|uniref:Non-specific serine/threonine protein kinase n=1 Tax=Ranatra chinensis TaxID=642074 RepID=A0ABD0YV34_9HEMI